MEGGVAKSDLVTPRKWSQRRTYMNILLPQEAGHPAGAQIVPVTPLSKKETGPQA